MEFLLVGSVSFGEAWDSRIGGSEILELFSHGIRGVGIEFQGSFSYAGVGKIIL